MDFKLVSGRIYREQLDVASDNGHAINDWALTQFGIRAVISTSFADIFRGNALKNGVLPVIVPADVHAELLKWGGLPVKID